MNRQQQQQRQEQQQQQRQQRHSNPKQKVLASTFGSWFVVPQFPNSVLCSEFWKRKARHAEIRWLVTIWNSERRQSEEWSLSLSLSPSLSLGRPSLLVCFPVPHPGHGSSVVAAASRAAKPPITEHQKAVSLSWSTWFACLIICSLNLCGFVCTFRDRQPSKPSSVTARPLGQYSAEAGRLAGHPKRCSKC